MVGPDFLRPSTKLSDQWLEADDHRVETSPAVYREWWKAFNDPVLENLIQTAYQQNLPLQIAGVRVFEATGTAWHRHWGILSTSAADPRVSQF